ncbi:hypothetical protein COY87_00130 [Candidatus Roizmanbacteria bacterium CG_4_10_14_0_8_um_filter_33_9]|uniref:Uncharacterized protein n=1 Tax=Candidatus Roizmanbacteria bacterium CG_4_10_14_0_8_um_filter_33_9 TaxID=1974826 RepID=A0A2M7QJU5_9BACT|nr:MAG: hypothetical protein COY87_00130 [Candidatus Roizmanbacteria bacterium CG_4_10_14_0_8_um_filter_33_9]
MIAHSWRDGLYPNPDFLLEPDTNILGSVTIARFLTALHWQLQGRRKFIDDGQPRDYNREYALAAFEQEWNRTNNRIIGLEVLAIFLAIAVSPAIVPSP